MHRLLHDIPRFLILFLEKLFLIFNQILSIGSFGRRDLHIDSMDPDLTAPYGAVRSGCTLLATETSKILQKQAL